MGRQSSPEFRQRALRMVEESISEHETEHAEMRRLKRENAELRQANEILRTASAFFAAELDRATTR